MSDQRRALLYAALACTRIKTTAPEVAMVRRWLDTWNGTGAMIVGMTRQGYDVSLTRDENGWRATFLHRSHVYHMGRPSALVVGDAVARRSGRSVACAQHAEGDGLLGHGGVATVEPMAGGSASATPK